MKKIELSDNELNDLEDFLLSRESDIALEMENFYQLKSIFKRIIGRKASKEGGEK